MVVCRSHTSFSLHGVTLVAWWVAPKDTTQIPDHRYFFRMVSDNTCLVLLLDINMAANCPIARGGINPHMVIVSDVY